MTPLSSTKEVNKQGFLQHINSGDPAIKFTVEDNKEDGFIPFWTPLLNQRLMSHCPSLCTGNPLIQTSTYSGTVTITSQPSSVLSTPSPIGHPQCAASLSCSKKEKTISGRLSLNANIPNGLWTRLRKDLTSPPDRLLMGTPQVPNLPAVKLKTRVTLSYPTHKVFVKASKRSVAGMASKPTSKVAEPLRAYWSPQGQRPYAQLKWCHLLVPMW